MALYYLDTSALAKRYLQETGTNWIASLFARRMGHSLYTVRLAGPEAIAAFARKARTGELAPAEAARVSRVFRRHWHQRLIIVEVTAIVTDLAMTLVERHGLRGYDGVHLATALWLADVQRGLGYPSLTFVSADTSQRQAAAREGLSVEDPNAHP